jgi:hypothetical protein
MKLLLFIITLFFTIQLQGQVDSVQLQMRIDSIKQNQEKWLHRRFGSPYEYPPVVTESTISLVPEFQIGRNPYFNIGLSKDFFKYYRKGVVTSKSFEVGLEYNFKNKIIAPKVSFSQSILFFHYRLNALYYLTPEDNFIAFRPEIGFNTTRLRLSFGRNIFLEKPNLETINKWNISVYYYLPIFPKRF